MNLPYICAAFLAWGLMGIQGPAQSVSFYIGSLHFVNWRLFLIICTFPALFSAVSLSVMPESPAYLLHVGCVHNNICALVQVHACTLSVCTFGFIVQMKQLKQLRKVLRKIQQVNKMCRCCLIAKEVCSVGLCTVNKLLSLRSTLLLPC